MKIELVEFPKVQPFSEPKFGVRRTGFFRSVEYCSGRSWYSATDDILDYCRLSKENAAFVFDLVTLKVKVLDRR